MTTKVLVFSDAYKAGFAQRSITGATDGQYIVRNRYSLVSPGTELALYTGRHIGFEDPEIEWCRFPLDIGYASVGEVIESRNPRFPAGCTVMHYGAHAAISLLGDTVPATVVPENLDPAEACFGRFAQIAYSSVAAGSREFHRVLVYGAGIVGNLAGQWFAIEGAESVRIRDLSSSRLEKAASCGLDTESDGSPETDVTPPDTIIEATGVPAVVNEALDRAETGGQVILLGSTRGTVDLNVYKLIHRKALILSGAHETVLGDGNVNILSHSLEALANGELKVAPLITHHIAPAELPGIYDRLLDDPDSYLGVLVDWSNT